MYSMLNLIKGLLSATKTERCFKDQQISQSKMEIYNAMLRNLLFFNWTKYSQNIPLWPEVLMRFVVEAVEEQNVFLEIDLVGEGCVELVELFEELLIFY